VAPPAEDRAGGTQGAAGVAAEMAPAGEEEGVEEELAAARAAGRARAALG